MSSKILNKENSQVVISLTIEPEKVNAALSKVFDKYAKEITVQGFRKGTAPANKVKEKIDETKLKSEVLNSLLPEAYKQVIEEHKLKPITDPRIDLKKFSDTEGVEVEITIAEKPEVELNDYKKALKDFSKKPNQEPKKDENDKTPEKTEVDKQNELKGKLLETVVNNAKITVPSLLVEQETGRMLNKLATSLQRMNITFEDYLKTTEKKAEDIKAEYEKQASYNLSSEFVLNKLGEELDIKVTDDEVKAEINAAPDENTKKELEKEQNRWYIEGVIFTRNVLEKLEKIANE